MFVCIVRLSCFALSSLTKTYFFQNRAILKCVSFTLPSGTVVFVYKVLACGSTHDVAAAQQTAMLTGFVLTIFWSSQFPFLMLKSLAKNFRSILCYKRLRVFGKVFLSSNWLYISGTTFLVDMSPLVFDMSVRQTATLNYSLHSFSKVADFVMLLFS